MQNEKRIWGRAAVVFMAGYVVEQAYAYSQSAIGQLVERVASFRNAGVEMLDHALEHDDAIVADLSNGDVARQAGLSFGAQRAVAEPANLEAIKSILVTSGCLVLDLDRLLAKLAARAPAPVAAGFFGPKGASNLAHFVCLLDADGLGTEAIAGVLGQVLAPQGLEHEARRLRDRREGVLDNIRHVLNRAKSHGLSIDSGGTRCTAETVPIANRVCVLLSKLDEHGRPLVTAVGGSADLPSADCDDSALDSNWTTFELTARTSAPRSE